jgi:3-phosphoshikimate 1-carboxyvinyltransferase
MKVTPANRLEGILTLNGDKSISHRAAMLAALATGETRIENFSTSADCASTLDCLEKLGVSTCRENSTVIVKGVGKTGFQPSDAPLDCGNSGTTARLLSGILAGQNFATDLTGDESLSKRPMKRIIEPLTQFGAEIESRENRLPLTIRGRNPLRAIRCAPETASAQVKSCVLLAGLNADGQTTFVEKTATRDHTERMLRWFGAEVEIEEGAGEKRISVSGDATLTARDFRVPADISSAAFFLVAAGCLKNSDLTIKNVGLNPTRRAIVDVLQNLGAGVEISNQSENCNEPIGDLRVTGNLNSNPRRNDSNVLRGRIIANLIDEIPILAIFGTQLENGLEIRDAAELRVKESDRIKAVVENLRRMNAEVEEFADGLRVGKSNLQGARVASFGDHRIAMAFAVAGLLAEGATEIDGAEAAAVSFPEFFETLQKVTK